MKKQYLFFFVILLLSCKVVQYKSSTHQENLPAPPGTIKISENLYFDKTEIPNNSWMDYMFWTKRVYGTYSQEYRECQPDLEVWSKLDTSYISLDTFYLGHPAYFDHPMVGITHEQAKEFTNWRSDRVMELYLINDGSFEYNPTTNVDSIFTIEKYFKGEYQGIKPNLELYYPEYSLPDTSIYSTVFLFADSLNSKNYKSCKKKFCEEHVLITSNCFDNILYKSDSAKYGLDPLKQTDCSFCKKEIITHLKGNVREMTKIKNMYYGISFIDSCADDYNKFRLNTSKANCYTGFRNSCSYKKWKQ